MRIAQTFFFRYRYGQVNGNKISRHRRTSANGLEIVTDASHHFQISIYAAEQSDNCRYFREYAFDVVLPEIQHINWLFQLKSTYLMLRYAIHWRIPTAASFFFWGGERMDQCQGTHKTKKELRGFSPLLFGEWPKFTFENKHVRLGGHAKSLTTGGELMVLRMWAHP